MTKYLYLIILIIFCSCKKADSNLEKNNTNKDTVSVAHKTETKKPVKLQDKTIKFLWYGKIYDKQVKDSIDSIIINEDFCKTITDPEKAALGYVATFIGNECDWEGAHTDDRSNLKCKILTALNLGYQCSDKHLGFLRKMFKNDTKVQEELKSDNCPTNPYTATIQNAFEEISLTVKGNEIKVFFKVNGFNSREEKSWSWTETDYFQVDNDNIKLLKKEESKTKKERF
jgi:hypothetical protein